MAHVDSPTTWPVPALAANTPEVRQWERLFGLTHRQPPRALRVDNHEGDAGLTLRCNGREYGIGPGAVVTYDRSDLSGPPLWYSIEADAITAAGDVRVYESYVEEDDE